MIAPSDVIKDREAFAARLNEAMEDAGYPEHGRATALAKQFEMTPKGGSKWLRGETMPESQKLATLATWLKVSVLWLWQGVGNKSLTQALEALPICIQDNSQTQVPVINWVQAGSWTQINDLEPEEVITWLPSYPEAGENGFGLIVTGESMQPYFLEGDLIYVNPDLASNANNGDLVIALCNGNEQATFKKLVIDGWDKYLVALNKDWIGKKVIELSDDCKIEGVVVGQLRQINKRTFRTY